MPDQQHNSDPRRPADLWALLPGDMAPLFRAGAASTAAEILREIQRAIPEFDRPLESAFGKVVTDGVQEAISEFIDRLADPGAPRQHRDQFFRRLGHRQLHHGNNLDLLLTAYRIGARVAWRNLAMISMRAQLPTATICLLAEALFLHIDELSALAVEGHAQALARAAGVVQRRRQRLLDLILSEPPAPANELADLAELAQWRLPEQVVAVAIEAAAEHPPAFPELAAEVLLDLEGRAPCLLLDAADQHHLRQLEQEDSGWLVAVGPPAQLAEAPRSLQLARRAVSLVRRGLLPGARVSWCEQHLPTLWLFSDPFLLQELVDRSLAPLTELTAKQRTKLSETLLAWLEARGTVLDLAARLGVHPQTVRYRLQQLEKLFGDRLEDSGHRFDLEIVLRALRAGSAQRGRSPVTRHRPSTR